jgi:hypothetical protein
MTGVTITAELYAIAARQREGAPDGATLALADDCERLAEEVAKLALWAIDLEETLRMIATPRRPDGTYNLCREACEQLARETLTKRRNDE